MNVLRRLIFVGILASSLAVSAQTPPQSLQEKLDHRPAGTLRIATYNASLNRSQAGELQRVLATPDDAQVRAIAEVIQRVRPDVLLINEFDYDEAHASLRLFARNYLARGWNGARSIRFAHTFTAPSNTGLPTGLDLNRDGRIGGGQDAQGFGEFPGQYGMAVYSRFPIDRERVRTFQTFLWRDMPEAAWPDDPVTGTPGAWYSEAAKAALRLSSKSHWDLPLRVRGRTVHLLASHPTPPAFDGPEDRNGRRNHDEVRFWADYLSPDRAGYIYDDAGRRGGLAPDAPFVIAGDLNADPNDGSSHRRAIRQLLEHPRVNATVVPESAGGASAAARQGGANAAHVTPATHDTADFGDREPGHLRVDYVLPSREFKICSAGVFWPTPEDPLWRLVNDDTRTSSDHRLVWIDVALQRPCPSARSTPTGQ